MAEPISIQAVLSMLTPISLTVGVIYYILILRNTQRTQQLALETRQAQLFMQVWDHWKDIEYKKQAEQIYFKWNWQDLDDFMDKYGPVKNPDASGILIKKITIINTIFTPSPINHVLKEINSLKIMNLLCLRKK